MLENETQALEKANEKNDSNTYTAAIMDDAVSEALNMNTWKLAVDPSVEGSMTYIAADETLFMMPVVKLEADQFTARVREQYQNAQA